MLKMKGIGLGLIFGGMKIFCNSGATAAPWGVLGLVFVLLGTVLILWAKPKKI